MTSSSNLGKSYTCHFPGCKLTYRRREHLTRHEAQHNGDLACSCVLCGRTFSRSDSLRRHIHNEHDGLPKPHHGRVSQACRRCRLGKVRCRGGSPCIQCRSKGHRCIFDSPTSAETNYQLVRLCPSLEADETAQVKQYVHLYFARFHPHWPILHRATFSIPNEPPLLLQTVLMIGLWVSGKTSARNAAVDLHSKLGLSIHEQREKWENISRERVEEENSPVSRCPVATYQAILIYIIFSLIVQDTTPRRMDFSAVLSPSDFQLLSALVGTCLRNDIFYYPRMLDRYHDISSVTCIWVGVEEIKRLGLALYKVSRLCSNGNCQESNTRGDNRLFRLSDLRFPLPASRRLWDAESDRELSRLLQLERDRGAGLDSRDERNWISASGRLLDSSCEMWWM